MSEKTPTVKVEHLDVQFGDFYAVRDVSFEVYAGEIFGFLGANGAGKTTTIRVLCGLLLPTSGEIRVNGFNSRSGSSQLKSNVGYMSQKFTLYDDLTVDENLNFAGELHFIEPSRLRERKQELLQFVAWNRELNVLVKDLPGGLKQQISLVASILHDPSIVFLDEPTAGVSPSARYRFWQLIRTLAGQGKTVFVTTHYMDEAEQCDRIALMRSGRLVALDSPSVLKKNTFARGLIEIDPHPQIDIEHFSPLIKQGLFSLFQPHGLRFHAEVREEYSIDEALDRLAPLGVAQLIKPSLEDVFIRIVEGKK